MRVTLVSFSTSVRAAFRAEMSSSRRAALQSSRSSENFSMLFSRVAVLGELTAETRR